MTDDHLALHGREHVKHINLSTLLFVRAIKNAGPDECSQLAKFKHS